VGECSYFLAKLGPAKKLCTHVSFSLFAI
jgi:hypothetical protein